MKKYIIGLLLIIWQHHHAQVILYTTNGSNRLSENELKEELSENAQLMSKALNKKFFGNLTIQSTSKKKDSIITLVSFNYSTNKPENLFEKAPFYDMIGDEFPKFEFTTLNGEVVRSGALKDRPTLINFWFTRCAPCIDEMPVLNKLQEQYAEDFNFIAITYEKKAAVDTFLQKHDFNFKHVIDAKDFIDQLGVQSYPMNLFLDKKGILRYAKGGIPYKGKDGEELQIGDGSELIKIFEELKSE
jgi:thiol-disulfide isomerase/thioredoxin